MADEVVLVTGKVSDAYSDTLHFYINGNFTSDNFMVIDKVPNEIIKILQQDRNKTITLKIKKNGGKNVFVSLEEQ
jgi:hypothetical protein